MAKRRITKAQYIEKIRKIMGKDWQKVHDKLVKVTNDYIESNNPKTQDDFKQLCYGSNLDNYIDDLALMRGWIEDRLNGHGRYDKKSITRKIRKLLGYTYP